MLNLEKNPFAKSTSTPPSTGSSIPSADKAVKRWQLEYGRTRKRVEDFSSQLDAARQALTEADQLLGDRLFDGVDVSEAEAALTQAGEKVSRLEIALKRAVQRDEEAQVSLKQAQQLIEMEVAREKLTKQLAAGKKVDECLDGLRLAVTEFSACRQAVLDLGDPGINAQLNVADLSFKTYLFRACPTMAGCATGYAAFQTDARWSAPWSETLPQPDQADHIHVTVPAAKPIPGWQIGE